MDIDVGSRMIVEFSTKERMTCHYIGQDADEFLLLKVPMTPGIRERLAEGQLLQFRFLKHGKIISFGAEILKYQASPASLAFISFPKEFSEYNLRHEGRVECLLPTTLAVAETACVGNIVDINSNGCRFVFNGCGVSVEEGAEVAGSFTTMEGDKKYEFKGTVVARQLNGDDKGLGIKFDGAVQLPEVIQASLQKMEDMREIERASKNG